MGLLSGAYCIPERKFKAIRSSNKTYVKGGFHLSEVFVNNDNAIRTKYITNTSEQDGLALLGAGKDGTVFIGHYGNNINDSVAIKIGGKDSLSVEFKLMKAVSDISPNVQHAYIFA